VHARCGFIINTLRKKTFSTGARQKRRWVLCCVLYVVLQLHAAVAIGHLRLQLSHYSLVALQAFCFPKCDFWGGLEEASKKFSRLAIARHIFRPPHKLCYNSTTAWMADADYVLERRVLSNLFAKSQSHSTKCWGSAGCTEIRSTYWTNFFALQPSTRRQLFSETVRIVRVLVVVPARAASTFSLLRRAKTWLRRTMTQKRLTHLALLHCHRQRVEHIDVDQLCKDCIQNEWHDIRRSTFGHSGLLCRYQSVSLCIWYFSLGIGWHAEVAHCLYDFWSRMSTCVITV